MKYGLFILKKLISQLLYPSGLVFILGLAGLILWLLRPGKKKGPALLAASMVLLLGFSLPVTSHLALSPLERWAGDYAQPLALMAAGVKDVVVLSGGCHKGTRNLIDKVGPTTTRRLMEGIRLWRLLPQARLVLSGGSADEGPKAEALADLAVWLGVPRNAMVIESTSWDTIDQARLLRRTLGDKPFALVTSASHLPRSMLIFKSLGMKPLAAPADFTDRGFEYSFHQFIPQADSLRAWDMAVHEYLGLAWCKLLILAGRLKP